MEIDLTDFKNTDIQLTDAQILTNIHAVQRRQNLPLSDKPVSSAGCKVNLDVKMEVRQGGGIKRIAKRLERGKNLFVASNERDRYRGFVISRLAPKRTRWRSPMAMC